MKSEELYSLTKPLIGHRLISIEKIDYSWVFVFSEDISIATESEWRLINKNQIVVSSEDHDQKFGLPEPVDAAAKVRSTINDQTVEESVISTSSGDLTIDFGQLVQLQLLQLSSGYESWRLYVQGSETICMGGGDIVHFPRP